LRVIIVSALCLLITALIVLLAVPINTNIVDVDISVTIPTTSKLHIDALVMHGHGMST